MEITKSATEMFSRRELFASLFFTALAACAAVLLILLYCPFSPFCLAILAAPGIAVCAAFIVSRIMTRRRKAEDGGALLDVRLDGGGGNPARLFQAMGKSSAYDRLRRARSERELLSATVELERRVLERTHELEELNRKLLIEIAERKRAEASLAKAAGTDPLTGLANRRAALEHLKYLMARHRREGESFAILLCDLDRFKRINDVFGHDAGDAALVGVAGALTDALRDQDMSARWGGEEFLVVLPDTDIEGGLLVAEKIRARLAGEVFSAAGKMIRLTVSVGVSVYRGEGVDLAIKAADEALYAAKSAGRNRVACEDTVDGCEPLRFQQ